jgi:hypothetical protein
VVSELPSQSISQSRWVSERVAAWPPLCAGTFAFAFASSLQLLELLLSLLRLLLP